MTMVDCVADDALLEQGTLGLLNHQVGLTGVDLFCGIGGFHLAARSHGIDIVFSCDIDEAAREVYQHNFEMEPAGDITSSKDMVPAHDVLMAGFPCQPFSIIGSGGGLDDPRGALIFDVVEIASRWLPRAVVLENVKRFSTHDGGRTLKRVTSMFAELGYDVDSRILNALDFGLPQKRERTIVVGLLDDLGGFSWPEGIGEYAPLDTILETDVSAQHFASDMIRAKRRHSHTATVTPSIWHENKGGNVSSHPFSCALRAGASYNYLLVDGERRLTVREMLRLQGFPEEYELPGSYQQARSLTGNSVPVPVISAVMQSVREAIDRTRNVVCPLFWP